MSTFEIKIVAPELAQALNALAAAIAGGTPRLDAASIATAETVKQAVEPEKPKATGRGKKAETAPAAEPASEEATSPGSGETASTPTGEDKAQAEAAPGVTYPDVQKRVMALAAINRDLAVGLLGEFGVSNGKELSEEQWGEFVQRADDKIAEVKGDA